jgi:dual specificity protein phosphatase 1B
MSGRTVIDRRTYSVESRAVQSFSSSCCYKKRRLSVPMESPAGLASSPSSSTPNPTTISNSNSNASSHLKHRQPEGLSLTSLGRGSHPESHPPERSPLPRVHSSGSLSVMQRRRARLSLSSLKTNVSQSSPTSSPSQAGTSHVNGNGNSNKEKEKGGKGGKGTTSASLASLDPQHPIQHQGGVQSLHSPCTLPDLQMAALSDEVPLRLSLHHMNLLQEEEDYASGMRRKHDNDNDDNDNDNDKSVALIPPFSMPHLTTKSYPSLITQGVYVGSHRSAEDWTVLQELRITHILNAASECANVFESKEEKEKEEQGQGQRSLVYLHLELQDDSGENILPVFEQATSFINQALATPTPTPGGSEGGGGRVLVHCHVGVSRSVSLVLAWLIAARRQTLKNALEAIQAIRSRAKPNDGFMRQLIQWEKMQLGQASLSAALYPIAGLESCLLCLRRLDGYVNTPRSLLNSSNSQSAHSLCLEDGGALAALSSSSSPTATTTVVTSTVMSGAGEGEGEGEGDGGGGGVVESPMAIPDSHNPSWRVTLPSPHPSPHQLPSDSSLPSPTYPLYSPYPNPNHSAGQTSQSPQPQPPSPQTVAPPLTLQALPNANDNPVVTLSCGHRACRLCLSLFVTEKISKLADYLGSMAEGLSSQSGSVIGEHDPESQSQSKLGGSGGLLSGVGGALSPGVGVGVGGKPPLPKGQPLPSSLSQSLHMPRGSMLSMLAQSIQPLASNLSTERRQELSGLFQCPNVRCNRVLEASLIASLVHETKYSIYASVFAPTAEKESA